MAYFVAIRTIFFNNFRLCMVHRHIYVQIWTKSSHNASNIMVNSF